MSAELLDGRFLKIRTLGEGAAGEVIEAIVTKNCEYASIGQKVAIKIYKPWVLSQPNQAIRIERELRAGLQISSEHIVRTYELASDNGKLFLVMELLKGVTLSQWIQDNPAPKFSTIVKLCSDILEGLYLIHGHGLIHRDIKPDNLMITEKKAVIMDFGVIKDLGQASTITGSQFLGTIRYAAPEYLFGESYDNKIDVYSFGHILHELVFEKPIINPKTYWSQQILRKKWDSYSDSDFDSNIYDRLGFRESRFIAVVLKGALSKRDERFTLEQIYFAMKNRIWEKAFLHYVDDIWPNIPLKLETEVTNFMEKHNPHDLKSFGERLYNATIGWHCTVWCFDACTEEKEILHKLFKLGLITRPSINEQLELTSEFTPLAWQLLIRGYFE